MMKLTKRFVREWVPKDEINEKFLMLDWIIFDLMDKIWFMIYWLN